MGRRNHRQGAALGCGLLVLCSLGCVGAPGLPTYRSFDDVDYGYAGERTIWSRRAGLSIRLAELPGPRDAPPLVLCIRGA